MNAPMILLEENVAMEEALAAAPAAGAAIGPLEARCHAVKSPPEPLAHATRQWAAQSSRSSRRC